MSYILSNNNGIKFETNGKRNYRNYTDLGSWTISYGMTTGLGRSRVGGLQNSWKSNGNENTVS